MYKILFTNPAAFIHTREYASLQPLRALILVTDIYNLFSDNNYNTYIHVMLC